MDLVKTYYAASVSGIKDEWLKELSTNWYNHIIQLPETQKNTYMICILQWQVYNGGFMQYFDNRYGQFAFETIEALETIGAVKKANLLKQAIGLVNIHSYSPSQFREAIDQWSIIKDYSIEPIIDALEELDDQYYKLENEEDEFDLLNAYLKE